jgi:hypothetical protein
VTENRRRETPWPSPPKPTRKCRRSCSPRRRRPSRRRGGGLFPLRSLGRRASPHPSARPPSTAPHPSSVEALRRASPPPRRPVQPSLNPRLCPPRRRSSALSSLRCRSARSLAPLIC